MSSNLPPGISSSDIPGNTKADQEWEELWEWLTDTGLEAWQIRMAVSFLVGMQAKTKEMFDRSDHQHDWEPVYTDRVNEIDVSGSSLGQPCGHCCATCGKLKNA